MGRLSIDDRRTIQLHLKNRVPVKRIADMMQISQATLVHEICQNGGVVLYDADKADQSAIDRYYKKIEGSRKGGMSNKGVDKSHKWKQRIENLEMQMEILTDQIKKLMKQQTEQQ